MGDIKPLGSEKLKGDDKLKRILELTYFERKNKVSNNNVEHLQESQYGVYGIVKEKDGYYVKKGLNENTLDYIGGMFMKNKNRFNSYAEALKRLSLLKGQEELLNEEKKYILKKPQSEIPQEKIDNQDMSFNDEPSLEGNESEPQLDDSEFGNDLESSDKPSNYMSEIQKYSGKLGAELRDQRENLKSDDIKYVINMVISAIDLNKLDPEDKEDISKKFDSEDVEDDGMNNMEDKPELSEPTDDELGETFNKLDNFVNDDLNFSDFDINEFADLEDEPSNDDVEIDLDEIKNELNRSIDNTLSKYFK